MQPTHLITCYIGICVWDPNAVTDCLHHVIISATGLETHSGCNTTCPNISSYMYIDLPVSGRFLPKLAWSSRQRFPCLPCTCFRTIYYHNLPLRLYAFSTTPQVSVTLSSVTPSSGGRCANLGLQQTSWRQWLLKTTRTNTILLQDSCKH